MTTSIILFVTDCLGCGFTPLHPRGEVAEKLLPPTADRLRALLRALSPFGGKIVGPPVRCARRRVLRVFRRRVAHLDTAETQTGNVATERTMVGDVRGQEPDVSPLAGLIAAEEPAAIGGICLDDPEIGMIALDIVVGVGAPLLVRTADPVNAELRQDVGRAN